MRRESKQRQSRAQVSIGRRHLARAALFRATAILLGLGVAFCLIEVTLRTMGYQPLRLRSQQLLKNKSQPDCLFTCYSSNPNHEFSPVPDVSRGEWLLRDNMVPSKEIPLSRLAETPWCVESLRSKQGIRNPHIDVAPAAGKVRIACVGDSFVFGEGVPEAGTLPRQLAARLGSRYEVDNFGVIGDDTSGELARIHLTRSQIECNRILLVFIANDIDYGDTLAARQTYVNDLINIRDENLLKRESGAWYQGHSKLLALIGSSLAMRRISQESIQWYRDLYDPKQNAAGLAQLKDQFRQLANLDSCQVVLVLYPLIEGLESNYPLKSVHEMVARLANEVGLPVCDLAPSFAGHMTANLQVHPVDHHPNSKAHKVAADAIETWLRHNKPGFLQPAGDPP